MNQYPPVGTAVLASLVLIYVCGMFADTSQAFTLLCALMGLAVGLGFFILLTAIMFLYEDGYGILRKSRGRTNGS